MAWALAVLGLALGGLVGWWFGRRRGNDAAPPQFMVERAVAGVPVLEEHHTGVVVADRSGDVVFRNTAARGLAGTHAGVLVDAAVERHLEQARAGSPGEETIELYGPPRKVFDVRSRSLPDGGAVVFVDDISERQRLDQVRTDFVANISHELKTPIGALAVLAETLEGETDPDTTARVLTRMMAEADRASRTIDDLMELSQIELDGGRAHEPVRLGYVVKAALDRVTEMAARRHVELRAMPSPEVVVDADRRQLVSAIGNLVENAVKYTDAGGSVEVAVGVAERWIDVTVTDNGVGIPQRDLNRIFERFYRVDRARSRGTGGTGLGLSIVRHVATNHGGEVTVTSTEGEGSTFVFRLPTDAAIDLPADPPAATAPPMPAPTPTPTPTQGAA